MLISTLEEWFLEFPGFLTISHTYYVVFLGIPTISTIHLQQVQDVKPLVRQQLIDCNDAIAYAEPAAEVCYAHKYSSLYGVGISAFCSSCVPCVSFCYPNHHSNGSN